VSQSWLHFQLGSQVASIVGVRGGEEKLGSIEGGVDIIESGGVAWITVRSWNSSFGVIGCGSVAFVIMQVLGEFIAILWLTRSRMM